MEARNLHPLTEQPAPVRLEDRLRLLNDVCQMLRCEHGIDAVFQTTLAAGCALSGARQSAYFAVDKDNRERLVLCASTGNADAFFAHLADPPHDAFLQAVSRAGEPLPCHDVHAHPLLGKAAAAVRLSEPSPPGLPASLIALAGRRSSGDPFGVFVFASKDQAALLPVSAELLTTLVGQAVSAEQTLEQTKLLVHEVATCDTARAERRVAELRLRQALDANQLGTWTWDAGTGMLDLDERGAELFGVAPHHPIARAQLRDHLIFTEDLLRVPEDLGRAVAESGKYESEYRIRDREGNLRWIATSGIPKLDETTGQAAGVIGTVQDISLRKMQEESLRQSEKLAATGRMAATIAHEINNPLEAVTNLIYLAKTDPGAPPAVQRLLETADTELARVSQIAQQTLGFYRDTTRPVSIDLNELLGAVVDLFGRKVAGKRLRVTLDLEPGLSIVGLRGEIRQVVSNLLVNAIDASEADGGPIRIRARHRQRNGCRGVSMMISDLGSGIPHHVRQQLFTPFVTTKESRGTGLGLWVTRGMVEKHGGSVRFRSRTDTPAGTVFCVFLPHSAAKGAFASPATAVLQ